MDEQMIRLVVAGATIAIGSIGPALAEGRALAAGLDAIARQPDSGSMLSRTLFVGLAMVESTAIYCLVIAFLVLFGGKKETKEPAEPPAIEKTEVPNTSGPLRRAEGTDNSRSQATSQYPTLRIKELAPSQPAGASSLLWARSADLLFRHTG